MINMYLPSDSGQGKKERNVFVNDILNSFYLRLYGIGHMVKNHSDIERRNPLLALPRDYLHAPYRGLCYTSFGTLTGTKINSMGPP